MVVPDCATPVGLAMIEENPSGIELHDMAGEGETPVMVTLSIAT